MVSISWISTWPYQSTAFGFLRALLFASVISEAWYGFFVPAGFGSSTEAAADVGPRGLAGDVKVEVGSDW